MSDFRGYKLTDVTPQIAKMRERLNAGRAQSEVLKLRLAGLSDAPPVESRYVPSFDHNLSNDKINKILSTLFKNGKTDAMVAFEEPNIPLGIPMDRLKEKSPVV